MRTFIRKLHLWLALPLGVFISVLCLSGAILVIERDIIAVLNSDKYHISVPQDAHFMDEAELIQHVEASPKGGFPVLKIEMPATPDAPAKAVIAGMGRADFLVNPYTGEVYGTPTGTDFFAAVRRLHRYLLIEPQEHGALSVGRILMGTSALGMTLLLLSGLWLWWPTSKRMLGRRLTVSLRKGWPRFVYDSHVSLGFYALFFLLLMSLTGPTWSFSWYGKVIRLLLPEGTEGRTLIFSLHTGLWGGLLVRFLYLITAIIGGMLPWSGYYLWWRRTHARNKKSA